MADKQKLWDIRILKVAIRDAFLKLVPQHQIRNPVMFTVYVGSILTTALFIQALLGQGEAPARFILAITLWLWFTILFANFAEAMAEGRGKAQAQALRKARREIQAKKLSKPARDASVTLIQSATLRAGDIVLVEAGGFIPSEGEGI
jgi:potassium-transporting ATPase ATP-binding subunit